MKQRELQVAHLCLNLAVTSWPHSVGSRKGGITGRKGSDEKSSRSYKNISLKWQHNEKGMPSKELTDHLCITHNILQLAQPLVRRGHAGVGKDRFPHMVFFAEFFSTDKTYLYFINTLWGRLLKRKVKKAESWRKWVSAFLRTTKTRLKAEVWLSKKTRGLSGFIFPSFSCPLAPQDYCSLTIALPCVFLPMLAVPEPPFDSHYFSSHKIINREMKLV